jgi:membrane dipeptidase
MNSIPSPRAVWIPVTIALISLLSLTLIADSASEQQQSRERELLDHARAIHARIHPFDGHLDVPEDVGLSDESHNEWGQFHLIRARRAGLAGASFAVFTAERQHTTANRRLAAAEALRKYNAIIDLTRRYPTDATLALTPGDVERAWSSNLFSVVLSMVNGSSMVDPLGDIDTWHARGLRIFGFVHWGNNDLADSSRPSAALGDRGPRFHGLSDLGRRVLARCNELGIIPDVSQLSTAGVLEVVSRSSTPVIASHSGLRALVDHPRNLTDAELTAIAAKGGLVQIVAYSHYIKPASPDWLAATARVARDFGLTPTDDPTTKLDPRRFAAYDRRLSSVYSRAPKATLEQYVDTIDQAVRRIGIDHVGIASDFNHGGGVIGWSQSDQCFNVTLELLRRGYTESDIDKLWGRNFLHLWRRVATANHS